MEKIPESMNFIQIEKPGDPDVLRLSLQSVPEPDADEVLKVTFKMADKDETTKMGLSSFLNGNPRYSFG